MAVSQSKIDEFIFEWLTASPTELRARLESLETKAKNASVIAEIKAIKMLLS